MQVTLSYTGNNVVKVNGFNCQETFKNISTANVQKLVILICGGIPRKSKLCEFQIKGTDVFKNATKVFW